MGDIRINYYFLKNFIWKKVYIFSLNPGKLYTFLKRFLKNVKLYSGFPGKMNFQVCGNPELVIK